MPEEELFKKIGIPKSVNVIRGVYSDCQSIRIVFELFYFSGN